MKFPIRNSIFLTLLVIAGACKNSQNVSVRGSGLQQAGDTVYLDEIMVEKTQIVQKTTISRKGNFRIKLSTSKPTFYQLRLPDNKAFTLILQPGDKVMLQPDSAGNSYTIAGSPMSADVARINNELTRVKTSLSYLRFQYDSLQKNNSLDKQTAAQLDSSYLAILASHKRYSLAYLLEKPASLASVLVIYQKTDDYTFLFNTFKDIQYFSILSDSLGKYYPEVAQVKSLRYNTNQFIDELNKARIAKKIEGKEPSLPEIRLPDWQGDTLSLSDFRGKIVLLSFWSPANRSSVAENLRMIPLYNRFRSKGFEIYQVGMAETVAIWNRTRVFDELPWPGVFADGGLDNPSVRLYNITGLPANFLIDTKQQDILGKNLRAAELEAKLTQLLR